MYVVYGYGEFFLPHCSNLKEKRKLVHGIIARVRKRFNVSISEVEYHDLWQRSIIGFTGVSSNNPEIELITNSIKETFLNYSGDMEITDFFYDTITTNFAN
ncbi:MAG: DUF503 domain-containing protein [Syntrophomonas sp.]